ncbi:TPA: hypothetical protein EYP44_01485, partial [Candidatus Bathyarchaeota archaeon]|nr:hypothetical protein [Candidatus Bathyarchaeota archaeon]
VTALIQRTGRSGHLLTRVSKGIIVCGHPDDVLESFVLANMALQDELETVKIHEKALDVLAHQLAGLVLDEGEVKAEEAFEVMRGAYPYRGLTHDEFERVARYLAELGYLAIADGRIRRVGMRTWRYYYEHLSMIPEELRFPVIDVETGDLIGSLGEDFYFLHAHEGLVFVCKGYPWKIVEMTGDGRVYVESVSDITGAIPGWEGRTLSVDFKVAMEVGKLRRRIASLVEEGRSIKELDERRVLDKGSTRLVTEYVRKQDDRGPVPSDRLVLIESDGRQVVVNCCFGHAVNLTLATVLRDIIRLRYGISSDVYRDAYRILIIPKEPLSAEDVKRALGEMTAERMRQFIVDNVDVYEIRHIALRFGAIPRSLVYKSPTNLPYLKYVYANTPIYDETLRETIMEFYDLENAIEVARMMREGEIEVRSVEGSISPMGRMILDRFKWLTEALTPETPKTLKEKIEGVTLDVLCFECGKTLAIDVGAAPNRLACECGSTTLLPLRWRSTEVLRAYRKWREGRRLGEDELKLFARAKMSGDLIRCYGKRGLVALLVRGIGPTTAARILARMHRTDDELFKDLLEAKRKYMETREYWD